MYHGELTMYLSGLDDASVRTLQDVPALDPFTHRFVSTPSFDPDLAADADLTIVALDAEADTWVLQDFLEDKDDSCDVIALAPAGRSAETAGLLSRLSDIWPMTCPRASSSGVSRGGSAVARSVPTLSRPPSSSRRPSIPFPA